MNEKTKDPSLKIYWTQLELAARVIPPPLDAQVVAALNAAAIPGAPVAAAPGAVQPPLTAVQKISYIVLQIRNRPGCKHVEQTTGANGWLADEFLFTDEVRMQQFRQHLQNVAPWAFHICQAACVAYGLANITPIAHTEITYKVNKTDGHPMNSHRSNENFFQFYQF